MTFDQTILLIFSQICIETNLEFDFINCIHYWYNTLDLTEFQYYIEEPTLK